MKIKDLMTHKRELERKLAKAQKERDYTKIWEISCKLKAIEDVSVCHDFYHHFISEEDQVKLAEQLILTVAMFDCANGQLMDLESIINKATNGAFASKALQQLRLCKQIVNDSVKTLIDECPQRGWDFSDSYAEVTEEVDNYIDRYLPNVVKMAMNKHITIHS